MIRKTLEVVVRVSHLMSICAKTYGPISVENRAQWLSRPWLDQSSKDHWPHQVVWSALRVMVIACVKRQAFKLPLPSYTNGARAMERRYNGPHIKWHLSEGRGRERWGGGAVKTACWSFQIHDRNDRKSQRRFLYSTALQGLALKSQCHYAKRELRKPVIKMVSHWAHCVLTGGFP